MRFVAASFLLMCSACTPQNDKAGVHREMVGDSVDVQKGRYQLIAANAGFPPIMIDTATGCVRPIAVSDKGAISFGETTLGGKIGASLDECNQHLFLRTDVVGNSK